LYGLLCGRFQEKFPKATDVDDEKLEISQIVWSLETRMIALRVAASQKGRKVRSMKAYPTYQGG
jgi:hypothetical protein